MKKAKAILSAALGGAVATTAFAVIPVVNAASSPKPITLSMYFGVSPSNYDNLESPVSKAIEKATGVKLKLEFPVGDTTQKEGLMIASGDLPDMIMAHGTNSVAKLHDTHSIIDMRKLINQYGPNIKKMYGAFYSRNQYSYKDKGIYYLGTQPLDPDNENLEPGNSFNIQLGVLKEAGYPKIKTLTDYENVIKNYVKKHPKINGQKTIGFTLIADDFRFFCSVIDGATLAGGLPGDGNWIVNQKTYQAKNIFLSDQDKTYFKWLNHMNASGLLDPEAFVQKQDQYLAKLATGRVVAMIDPNWNWSSVQTQLRAKEPWRQYAELPVVLNNKIVNMQNQGYGYSPSEGTAITKKCKNPERAIKFLDYLCSEEGQILIHSGVKGVDYSVDKNGKRYQTAKQKTTAQGADYAKKSGVGFWLSSIFPNLAASAKDSTGQYIGFNQGDEAYFQNFSKEAQTVLTKYGVKDWNELWPDVKKFPVRPYGRAWEINFPTPSKAATERSNIENAAKKYVPKMILAKPGDFDKVWKQMADEMKADGNADYEKTMTSLIKQRIETFKEDKAK